MGVKKKKEGKRRGGGGGGGGGGRSVGFNVDLSLCNFTYNVS